VACYNLYRGSLFGFATERLQGNATFQQASYGFTVFAILGRMCAFGLVALGALFNLVSDLPLLIGGRRMRFVVNLANWTSALMWLFSAEVANGLIPLALGMHRRLLRSASTRNHHNVQVMISCQKHWHSWKRWN